MSDEEVLLRKGRFLEEFVAAKTKLRMLQEEASREAKVLSGIVEYLRTGGTSGRMSQGMPPESYLSAKLAKLVNDLSEAHHEKSNLQAALASFGVTVE